MLKRLFIQNYTLIETLDITFHNGFSVITGETGAGKSIILGAIGLLLGQRADTKAIRKETSKCIIEATFALESPIVRQFLEDNDFEADSDECIVRRELLPSGKSRSFINDTPAQLTQLKTLGEQLLDVHSQHKNLLLGETHFQLNILDTLAHHTPQLASYQSLFQQYRKAQKQLQAALNETQKNQAEQDYLRFIHQQLEEANLQDGEQEELEEKQDLLNHAEEIKSALFATGELLQGDRQGVVSVLRSALSNLQHILSVYGQAQELYDRLDSCYIELKDLADELNDQEERIEFNPRQLDEINDRLDLIYSLQKKHGKSSVAELLTLQQEIAAKLESIDHSDEQIEHLQAEANRLDKLVRKQARLLSAQRQASASVVEKEMVARLQTLGMPHVQFIVELTQLEEPTENGIDKARFLFNANKGHDPQDLTQIASGGEIARVMLSLKALMAGAIHLPSIIFDEIDTGVSGQMAERMAQIMQEMGTQGRQVISITHLPQIAAKGEHHYKVYKEEDQQGTTSHIIPLDEQQRIQEIAHMLSGSQLTEAALNNAKELLK